MSYRLIDETVCPVAADFSHHGIQLPCHQSLRDAEIDWMVALLRDLVAGASERARNA